MVQFGVMESLYGRNGLLFWDHESIKIRQMMMDYFAMRLEANLKSQNKAFEMIQIEAPILTPLSHINPQYTSEDVFFCEGEQLALRPETTMGSYAYAEWLLTHHKKTRLPFVVWQHGKSFRREQDQVMKNMRLKEFYQQEFQIMYSPNTANDYSVDLVPEVRSMIAAFLGDCWIEKSDRTPSYAEWTQDVVCDGMEVCSMSKRTDCPLATVLEVAIGTDRCVYQFLQKKRF